MKNEEFLSFELNFFVFQARFVFVFLVFTLCNFQDKKEVSLHIKQFIWL
jgi:hypothetical protein